MTSISQVQTAVYQGVFDNQMSAGADAAAKSMDALGNSVEVTDTKVTAHTKSAAALVNAYDPATQAANRLASAQKALAAAQDTMSAAVATGTKTQDQANAVIGTLTARVDTAKANLTSITTAQAGVTSGTKGLSDAVNTTSEKLNTLGGLTSNATREFTILGHELLTGEWSRASGTAVVLAERMGTLERITESVFDALQTPTGLAIAGFVAVIAAVSALGVVAEVSERQLLGLQTRLQATRADYVQLSEVVKQAAKDLAATTAIGTTDARTAGLSIASAANFSGSKQALEDLIKLADGLAAEMGTTLPEEAAKLAKGMGDPLALASQKATEGFRGFDQALLDNVKNLQDSGDKARAFAIVQKALTDDVAGAAERWTPLQKSVHDLSDAFTRAGQDGRSLADVLGSAITSAAAYAISAMAGVVRGIEAMRTASQATGPQIQNGYAGTTGNVTTSSAGALGIFQLMPQTAAGLHVNPNDASQNILGGLSLLQQLSNQYSGDVTSILRSYGGFSAGNTSGLAAYSGRVAGANTSVLSQNNIMVGSQTMTVEQGIEYWGQVLGLPANLIALGKQIAVVESGGQQFSGTSPSAPVNTNLLTLPASSQALLGSGVGGLGSATDLAIGGPGAVQDQISAALKLADSLGTVAEKAKALTAEETLLKTAMALVDPGSPKYKELADALEVVKGKEATNLTTTQQYIKGLKDQADVSGIQTGAAKELADAQQKLNDVSFAATGHVADQNALDAARAQILQKLRSELQLTVDQTARQVAANQSLVAATEQGGSALDDLTSSQKAQIQALQFGKEGSDEYNLAVVVLTASNRALAASSRDVVAAQDVHNLNNQIELYQTEIDLIGASVEQRNREIAVLQERQRLGLQVGQQADDEQQKALDAAGKVADLQTRIAADQASVNELANAASQAFDQLGAAMVQAFVGGQGAAVNWGNVVKAVITQVLTELAKLAVLNPILNELFPSTQRPTLGGVLDSFGGNGSGATNTNASSGGSGFSLINNGGSLISGANTLSGGSLFQSLGLTGPGGLTEQLGLSGSNGIFSGIGNGVTGILNGGILGTSTSEASLLSTNAALAAEGFGAGGAPGVATAGSVAANSVAPTGLFGGASFGTVASGVGLGFGAGSIAGGLVQGALGKVGPAPEIGAAGGAIAGAAIGSVVPVIGTLLGAIIGGLVGGGGGGLIGPKAPSPFSSIGVSTDASGQLQIGKVVSQIDDVTQLLQQTTQQVQALNAFLQANGISIVHAGSGNAFQVGLNTPGGFQDPNKFGTLNDAFSSLLFASSSNPQLSGALNQHGSFGSPDELQQFVAGFQTFITQTMPALTANLDKSSTATDQYQAQIDQLNATYNAAIVQAQAYGLATDDLVAAQAKAIQSTADQKTAAEKALQSEIQATVSGNATPADPVSAALAAFDQQSQAVEADIKAKFASIGVSAEDSATTISQVEQALANQRVTLAQNMAKQVLDAQISLQHEIQNVVSGTTDPLQQALDQFDQNAAKAVADIKTNAVAAGLSLTDLAGTLDDVTHALANQRQAIIDAAVQQRADLTTALQREIATAITGAATDPLQQLLAQFDAQSASTVADIKTKFAGIGASASDYASTIVQVEQGLATQRLAVIDKFNADAAAALAANQAQMTAALGQLNVRSLTASGQGFAAGQASFGLTAANDITTLTTQLQGLGATAQQVADAVAQLTAAQVQEKQALIDANNASIAGFDATLKARQFTDSGNTLAAQLATFDQQAAAEMATAKANLLSWGLTASDISSRLAALSDAQATERNNLITAAAQAAADAAAQAAAAQVAAAQQAQQAALQAAQQAFQTAQAAYLQALNAQIGITQSAISSTESQISAIQSNTTALTSAADSMQKFAASLAGNSQISPLTPIQQLQSLQAQLGQQVGIAGNTSLSATDRAAAASQVQQLAQSVLAQGIVVYGKATLDYSNLFNQVQSSVNGVAQSLSSANTTDNAQLAALNAQLSTEKSQLSQMQSDAAAAQALGQTTTTDLVALQTAMNTAFANLQAVQAAQTTAATTAAATQVAATTTTNADIAALQTAVTAASTAQVTAVAADTTAATTAATNIVSAITAGFAQNHADLLALGQTSATSSSTATSAAGQNSILSAATTASNTAGGDAARAFVNALYIQGLGTAVDPAGFTTYYNQIAAGQSLLQVGHNFKLAMQAAGKTILPALQGFADGGWVSNGVLGVDSVRALLSGGEFVVPTAPAAKYADILPQIRNGTFANDNSLRDELRAIRAEVVALRQVSAAGHIAVKEAVNEGTSMQRSTATAAKLKSAR